jgi:hypothetical protein
VAVAACHTPVGFASLRGYKLLAPQLMVTEASSVLHEMAWRGEITKPRARTMLERIIKAQVGPDRADASSDGSISRAMTSAETACRSRIGLLRCYSNSEVQERLRRLAEKLERLAGSDAAPRTSVRHDQRLRSGVVPKAIEGVPHEAFGKVWGLGQAERRVREPLRMAQVEEGTRLAGVALTVA